MNKVNIEVHDKLKHLTTEQINMLIDKYYNNESTKVLIKEYKIDTNPSKLYTLFPPMVCEDVLCPNCNIPMIKERESKTNSSYRNKNAPKCFQCGHSESNMCRCDLCTEKRKIEKIRKEEAVKKELERKRELINTHYNIRNNIPVEYSELMFRDKVYLGALMRFAISEDLEYIKPVDDSDGLLAPTDEMKKEIILSLTNKSLIKVHPNSPIEAFAESEKGPFPTVYYIYKTNYHLNVGKIEHHDRIVRDLMNPPEFDKLTNNILGVAIWKEIALAECLQYLLYQVNKVKLSFAVGEKTNALFEDLLENFSVSQIYGIIYKGVTSATRYYQENNITKQHAGNSIIGACQRYAESALVNKWELSKYHRIPDLPQSMISEFFFNRVLKIGDEGFYTVPRKL